ncbi:UDP-3-O-[3-hydroxymyristoyl] glucosamine N-acyltransferase [Nitratiruptor sp. YY08-26]|uniref:UDP-3-O-(3-hydroxymyristoyl)glucosamine N-acyltransferase n=1 Tax=unclassified Nitratiruptor TaxID=2624044 RepID=UPI00191689DB|nr:MULTISPECIES: UDP-3-O-(3-hydroxymyristoyl)glucosamine N-acyltransferase [unclassified Nitratiruptor]BCD62165.1 UDP-3-O-[3-hydroxymyristoyl] glucosamine N-acyltransferase [Nitratiruptor sp. YY08-13]BCD66101.1 UDP-3-O-[3-hydroxymyristoyl] glucosamine N-acyltransferase [Nitratiruptor sp. YY08-26]
MRLSDIAKQYDLELVGEDKEIHSLAALQDAKEDQLSFLENKKYLNALKKTQAGAVIVKKEFLSLLPKGVSALISEEPYLTLAYISKLFAKEPMSKSGKEPQIGNNCTIAQNVSIGFNTVIGDNVTLMPGVVVGENVTIGDNTLIYPNVTIYRDCHIGKNCIIHAGTVIGSDGYGFAHTKNGRHIKIYQNGNVIIEDDVEIGANCAIDRAVFGSTIIKKGTKIDNLIQIGHNCIVGENVLMAGQSGLSGSTIVGKNVTIGGQAATAGHLTIGDYAVIAARGGVTKSIPGGKVYSGFPLMEHKQWLKLQALLVRLLKRGNC